MEEPGLAELEQALVALLPGQQVKAPLWGCDGWCIL